jgi:L-alanine-DL-glutamate epimerase-like enolase superfamily enzyme
LEYLEQPIPAEPLADAAWLRRQTRVPIALNESVVDPASVLAILRADAASRVFPIRMPRAGSALAWRLATCARRRACRASCTAARLSVRRRRPCCTSPPPARPTRCPTASTYYGLADDVLTEPFQIERGSIAVPTRPGLGIEVDREKLRKYRLDG